MDQDQQSDENRKMYGELERRRKEMQSIVQEARNEEEQETIRKLKGRRRREGDERQKMEVNGENVLETYSQEWRT